MAAASPMVMYRVGQQASFSNIVSITDLNTRPYAPIPIVWGKLRSMLARR